MNPAAKRSQVSLGDTTGLTKTGIHHVRLPGGGIESTTLHYHMEDDEWFYILDAPDGAVICTKDGTSEIKEETVRKGDFLAFAAGRELAHRFRNEGDRDLVYLCGGSREKIDVCRYPEIGKWLVDNRAEGTEWVVDGANIMHAPQPLLSSAKPSSSAEDVAPVPYHLRTTEPDFEEHSKVHHHGLDPKGTEWYKNRMGDRAGLTRVGIHLNRVRPNKTSTVMHWHGVDDEWFFVLEAGDGAVLSVDEGKGKGVEEHAVRPGDFAAFPAGKPCAHAFKSGSTDLVYLCGGSRERVDECHYPGLGKRAMVDRGQGRMPWVVSENTLDIQGT
jgi:uncharacterized cupin superfamily protein